ncbi:hypothetical protein QTP88_005865 [Uroleucon formosanum]
METALSSKKSNACGIDNIPTIFLLNLPKNGKLYLLKIFNHIWMENQYPTTWLTAIIKPIHKPNKPKNHVSSYRPISIICSMTKLLEKIINARLMWYLESNNLLSNLQHGFRKNNSTLDSLAIIENEIKETFNQNQYLVLLSLDLQKAFDTIWRHRLIKYMVQLNLKGASALTIKTLEPIHNTALRLSIDAFKSSPVLSIINITGSKSLEKRRIKHTLEYSSKTLIATKNPISTILRNSINQFQNNDINNLGTRTATYASDLNISFTNQLNPQASEQPPWITSNLLIYFNLTAHKKKETDSYIYKSNFFNLKNSLPPHQEIYIDASKNTEGTAIAIIQPNSQTAFQIPSYNSIYTAEYLALLKATELAASSDIQSSTIYTNSLSALTNLANPQKNNPIGNLILNIIFLSKKDIRFLWVPGHNNIPGNEIADEIAKKATKEPTDFWNITTHLDTKLLINTNLDQTCLQEWRSLRNNKLREMKSSTLPWLPDTSLPRRHQIVLNRLRIGHTLYTHEHLMSKKEQPICTSCNTVTTVKHLLTECLLTKDARDKLMLPNNLCEILAPKTERTSSLLELLKETNLLQKI